MTACPANPPLPTARHPPSLPGCAFTPLPSWPVRSSAWRSPFRSSPRWLRLSPSTPPASPATWKWRSASPLPSAFCYCSPPPPAHCAGGPHPVNECAWVRRLTRTAAAAAVWVCAQQGSRGVVGVVCVSGRGRGEECAVLQGWGRVGGGRMRVCGGGARGCGGLVVVVVRTDGAGRRANEQAAASVQEGYEAVRHQRAVRIPVLAVLGAAGGVVPHVAVHCRARARGAPPLVGGGGGGARAVRALGQCWCGKEGAPCTMKGYCKGV